MKHMQKAGLQRGKPNMEISSDSAGFSRVQTIVKKMKNCQYTRKLEYVWRAVVLYIH